ncbi:MAG: MCE family protein, partial [Muribaculaceae bacterium]|nr:MCE family protein [Muribaculaceae bacterium]
RGLLAAMGPVASDLKIITANVDSITSDLAGVSHQLNEAHVDSIMNSLQTTVANLELLTAQLNDPNSSIGKLTNDPALYDNINATVVSLDSLFTDIKKNPKRYINIKVF